MLDVVLALDRGLNPAASHMRMMKDVDGRDKPGHDDR